MKISEFTTERAADALCEIGVFVLNILTDEEVMAAFKEGAKKAKNDKYMGALGQIVPLLFKKHREDVFGILAVLNDTDINGIREQNILKTMEQIREIAKDKDLLDFFEFSAKKDTK